MKDQFTTLIELKLAKIGERIMQDVETDWKQSLASRDFRPGELEELADKYVTNSLLSELYLQSSKNLLK